jgi:hypothetical protein
MMDLQTMNYKTAAAALFGSTKPPLASHQMHHPKLSMKALPPNLKKRQNRATTMTNLKEQQDDPAMAAG